VTQHNDEFLTGLSRRSGTGTSATGVDGPLRREAPNDAGNSYSAMVQYCSGDGDVRKWQSDTLK